MTAGCAHLVRAEGVIRTLATALPDGARLTMSGWTPSPEDPGGSPANPGSDVHQGDAGPSGFGTQPGDGTQPGFATQPGYGTQPGYEYGRPGPAYPPTRSRWRMWLGIGAGFVVLVVVIAGISAYLLVKPKNWKVPAPQTVAGMSRDTSPTDQQGFAALVQQFKNDVTRLPNYGSLKSTVSGIYRLGPDQAVGLIGFNGTFKVQVTLKTGAALTVSSANPGPHGGTAECGISATDAVCQWSTGTTVGIVVVIPTSSAAGQESVKTADNLMIKVRGGVEHTAHG